jgi:hypothetical protein
MDGRTEFGRSTGVVPVVPASSSQHCASSPPPIQTLEGRLSGDPASFVQKTLDSRFRGNDDRALRGNDDRALSRE